MDWISGPPGEGLVRAFFALRVPDNARLELVKAQRTLKRIAGHSRPNVRWLDSEQLHLTLKFLGSVDQRQLLELAEFRPNAPDSLAAIDTGFTGITAFPAPHRARVIVATLADPAARIEGLAAALESAAESVGIPREKRKFQPHVTIGRIRQPGDVHGLLARCALDSTGFQMSELVLFRSILKPSGATYEPLARSELTRAVLEPGPKW
jgi:2'-5' RNA ligase